MNPETVIATGPCDFHLRSTARPSESGVRILCPRDKTNISASPSRRNRARHSNTEHGSVVHLPCKHRDVQRPQRGC